jgi:hypothetical protein
MTETARQKQIKGCIDDWLVREPDLRSRLEKARMLVDNIRVAVPASDGTTTYLMEGSHERHYTVTVTSDGAMTCSCEDRKVNWHYSHCKHQIAVKVHLTVPSPAPLDPRAFEQVIREWANGPKPDEEYEGYDPSLDEPEVMQPHPWTEWLDDHGHFAIRMLLAEIDRLRALVPKGRKT